MKNLLLIMMLLISSIVLSQNKRTFLVDQDTNLVAEKTQDNLIEIDLFFEDSIPSLTQNQISSLLKKGELERFVSKTKGVYDKGILFYIPKDYFEYFYLQEGDVLYIPPYQKQKQRVVSWWFIFAFFAIVSMILYQMIFNRIFIVNRVFIDIGRVISISAAIALSFGGFFVFCANTSFVTSGLAKVAYIIAGFFSIIVVEYDRNKKLKNIFTYIYYVFMVLACVLAYFQI